MDLIGLLELDANVLDRRPFQRWLILVLRSLPDKAPIAGRSRA